MTARTASSCATSASDTRTATASHGFPRERILFTGDAAVNGPFNYMADGDSGTWIETLASAQKLGATIVAPGHGPSGDAGVLEAQRQYFVALRAEVAKRKGLAPERVQADVPAMRDALLKQHATYIDTTTKSIAGFEAQAAQVYKELTGREFPKRAAMEDARQAHSHHHGIAAIQ